MSEFDDVVPEPDACEIDTCGENRDDGEPWPVIATVTDCYGQPFRVCACHLDGWWD